MDATQRPLTDTELDTIMKALITERDMHGSPVLALSSPFPTRLYIFTKSQRGDVVVFTNNGILAGILMFSVGGLWWSDKPMLFEELVLSVGTLPGVQREAIKALNHLAKELGCSLIAAGCLIQEKPQMVMNGYRKDGFTILNPMCIKLVDGGDKPCSHT